MKPFSFSGSDSGDRKYEPNAVLGYQRGFAHRPPLHVMKLVKEMREIPPTPH
jgi:hypothetical protein